MKAKLSKNLRKDYKQPPARNIWKIYEPEENNVIKMANTHRRVVN
jgi:hypothetical protein